MFLTHLVIKKVKHFFFFPSEFHAEAIDDKLIYDDFLIIKTFKTVPRFFPPNKMIIYDATTLYYEIFERGSSSRTIKQHNKSFFCRSPTDQAKKTQRKNRKVSRNFEIKTQTIRSNDKKVYRTRRKLPIIASAL